MNFRGHIWFALGIGVTILYILGDLKIISLPTQTILFYLPIYILGAIIVDKIERPTSRWHRGLLHSKRMLYITIFLLIPMMFIKMSKTPYEILFGVEYNNWSLGLAGLLGHTTHLIGDSLTSRLPK